MGSGTADGNRPEMDMEKAASLREAAFMVELSGVEPLTSCMPCKRSTS